MNDATDAFHIMTYGRFNEKIYILITARSIRRELAITRSRHRQIHTKRTSHQREAGTNYDRNDKQISEFGIIYKSAKTHVKEKRACKSFSLVGFLQEQPVERRENANSCCHHQVT